MGTKSKGSALDGQVGGDHYKNMGYQPVWFITQCNLPFVIGNIVKYISRYKFKNGAEDILKCIHYAEIGKELKIQKTYSLESLQTDAYVNGLTRCYIEANKLNRLQAGIVHAAVQYSFDSIIAMCQRLMEQEYPDDAKKMKKILRIRKKLLRLHHKQSPAPTTRSKYRHGC